LLAVCIEILSCTQLNILADAAVAYRLQHNCTVFASRRSWGSA
jgi:hypothetical protein